MFTLKSLVKLPQTDRYSLKLEYNVWGSEQIHFVSEITETKQDAVDVLKHYIYSYMIMNGWKLLDHMHEIHLDGNHKAGGKASGDNAYLILSKYLRYLQHLEGEPHTHAEKALGYWVSEKQNWKCLVPHKDRPSYSLVCENITNTFYMCGHFLSEFKKDINQQFNLVINEKKHETTTT